MVFVTDITTAWQELGKTRLFGRIFEYERMWNTFEKMRFVFCIVLLMNFVRSSEEKGR